MRFDTYNNIFANSQPTKMYAHAGLKIGYILGGRYRMRATGKPFNYSKNKGIEYEDGPNVRRRSYEAIRQWVRDGKEPTSDSIYIVCEFANRILDLPVSIDGELLSDEVSLEEFYERLGVRSESSSFDGWPDSPGFSEYYFSERDIEAAHDAVGGLYRVYRRLLTDSDHKISRLGLTVHRPARVTRSREDNRRFIPISMTIPSEYSSGIFHYSGMLTEQYAEMTALYLRQEEGAHRDICFSITSRPEYDERSRSIRRGYMTTTKISNRHTLPVPYRMIAIREQAEFAEADRQIFMDSIPKNVVHPDEEADWQLIYSSLNGEHG